VSKLETVFDVETDGFDATKVHVLSYQDTTMPAPISMFTLQEMKDFFKGEDRVFIGHNIIRFDIPQLKKFISIPKDVALIDTLPLSWYLKFDRVKHGLDSFHEDYGIAKPVVTDWEGLSPEEYAHRCEEDVKINMALWLDLKKTLRKLYP
jgi:DNA polymerase III alpha subunit (gram-positive type)